MRRVLLYLDDYSELVYMETLFKKLGFDAQGVQTVRAFEDALLALNPEVCIMTARGKRVHGLDVAESLTRKRGSPKIMMFAPRGLAEKLRAENIPFVDAWVETPPMLQVLLSTLATTTGMDPGPLIEKYKKIRMQMPEVQGYHPAPEPNVDGMDGETEEDRQLGGVTPGETTTSIYVSSTLSEQDRRERYQLALSKLEKPTVNGFARDKVERWTKLIRREENVDVLKELEAERSSFVKALFNVAKRPFKKA